MQGMDALAAASLAPMAGEQPERARSGRQRRRRPRDGTPQRPLAGPPASSEMQPQFAAPALPAPAPQQPQAKAGSKQRRRASRKWAAHSRGNSCGNVEAPLLSSSDFRHASDEERAALLLAVSCAHATLCLSPVEFLSEAVGTTTNYRRKAGRYVYTAPLWLALAAAICLAIPVAYARYKAALRRTASAGALELALQGWPALLILPCTCLASFACWLLVEVVARGLRAGGCISRHRAATWRQAFWTPFYYAFFWWLRRKVPDALLNDFRLFMRVPNRAMRALICLGYLSVTCPLFAIEYLRGDVVAGICAAVAFGELYLLSSNFLLAPPAAFAATVRGELRSRGSGALWQRLYQHSGTRLELGSADALEVAKVVGAGGRAAGLHFVRELALTDLDLELGAADLEGYESDRSSASAGLLTGCCHRPGDGTDADDSSESGGN